MDSKLNNILGEYLSFFTGGFMKGGASPKFDQEIRDAKKIDDLLPVVKYYFCYKNTGVEREITAADLHLIDMDKIQLHKTTRNVNTEYREHQEPIVNNLVDSLVKNNLDHEQINDLYKIGVKFSDIIRYDNTNPPRELLPNSINPNDPNAPKGSEPPPMPPGDFVTAFRNWVISGIPLPKNIQVTDLLQLKQKDITGITGSNAIAKGNLAVVNFILKRAQITASSTDKGSLGTLAIFIKQELDKK